MKIAFIDENNDNKKLKYEIKPQDLNELFKIADKLSDTELEKLETAIDRLPEITGDKEL